jgi:serine/threonine protein kinase
MSLAPGTRLGAYEVIGPLGAGGMGEVYRARDTRLHRDVAIKILPAAFASDADRLMRFEREAQTLAALNHPHIAQIHGLEESLSESGSTLRALVMEFVDGEALDVRLARGPLPIDEAVAIARQITDALEAAHEQGIVHRDLKPANIKVRGDGAVKVLDFGLAKALDATSHGWAPADDALLNSPTITSPAHTMRGVILGTAAYMSPEQARGRAVDKRADIWAFGAIVHEMLTATRLFDGETMSDTIAAVLTRPVDLKALPSSTPPRLRELIARCLERDPKRRLRDIGDARVLLETHAADSIQASSAVVPPRVASAWGRHGLDCRRRRPGDDRLGALAAPRTVPSRECRARARAAARRGIHHRIQRRRPGHFPGWIERRVPRAECQGHLALDSIARPQRRATAAGYRGRVLSLLVPRQHEAGLLCQREVARDRGRQRVAQRDR